MREEKYCIINEYGEVVRVTKEEYEKWSEENKDNPKSGSAPKFQTPEQQEERRQRIKEYLNILDLKEEEMVRLDNEVKTIDKENSEEKSTEEKENGR